MGMKAAVCDDIVRGRVAAGNWAIDDAGSWHDLCASLPDFEVMAADERLEFERGSLFWFGMVFVTLGPSGVTVRWSVTDVHQCSLHAAIRFLTKLPDNLKVSVEYFFGGWECRVAESPRAAVNMLEAAKRLHATIPIVRPFVKRLELTEIGSADSMVRSGLEFWERSGGKLAVGYGPDMRNYLGHCLVFSPGRGTDTLIYRHLGRHAALTNFKGPDWAASVLGKTCGRALEDASAGSMLSDVYGEVLQRGEPRYDHVRARIPRAGREVEWVTYQRLLTPMKDRLGRPALLCLAVTTPDVRIPVPVQIPSDGLSPVG